MTSNKGGNPRRMKIFFPSNYYDRPSYGLDRNTLRARRRIRSSSQLVELARLARYPLSNKVIADRDKEVLAKFKNIIENDY